jgi:hypothetical protein
MFARMSTFQGSPERIEEGLRVYREEVIPWLRDATGYRGWLVLLDRQNRTAVGITFWSSEKAATDAEAGAGALRAEVAASVGALLQQLDLYEVAAYDSLPLGE